MCVNNESLWCSTNVVKRIASHESQGGFPCRGYNSAIVWRGDLYPIYLVSCDSRCGLKENLVIAVNVFQTTKEGVTMASNSDVPGLTRKGRPFDMTDSQAKRLR